MRHRAIIAFGANLGDREKTLRAALAALDATPGLKVTAVSPLYASDPVGYADQPEFINGVAALDTSLAPEELLHLLLKTETAFGRVRTFANGPRTLDLDLLFYDGLSRHSSQSLTLPHPRWRERPFVPAPLADLLAARELAPVTDWDDLRAELKALTDRTGIRRWQDSGKGERGRS